MLRRSASLALLALTTYALAACSGGDDDAATGDDDVGGDDDASSSSGSTTPPLGSCFDPASFDYAVPLRKDGESSLVGYDMRADGSTVFMTGTTSVFALNTTTRAFDVVYDDPTALFPHVFPRASDLLVYSRRKLVSVPKTGGAATALPDFTRRPATSLVSTYGIELDGNTFYAMDDDDDDRGRFFTHDVTTGAEADLAQENRAAPVGFRLGADALYGYYPTSAEPVGPTELFRLPKTGGPIAPLAFTGAPSALYPYAVRGNDLFLIGANPAAVTGTLYRASTAGGAVAALATTAYPLARNTQAQAFDAEGGVVFRAVDTFYWLPTGAASATRLGCIGGEFTLQAATAVGRTLYASVVNATADVGGVIRIPIP